ncbi:MULTISPECIES: hypothetical protein [Bacillus cereus group]|uniref:hypothetical protein n=1 Tax=Bacillus cereus group TaxID=86661 RepID=UPI000BFA9AAB|nr:MULTISPECIES: hypothetical protein [Bacillus cereus group]PFD09613.1 hypothetical protein CN295_22405 [Bacillus cereus]PGV66936.1 hypothetical protein COD84_31060 [Bacillus cereus]
MNILIDASTYSIGNSMGGIGVRLWELAQVLSKNYFITFLVNKESDFEHPNIKFEIYQESNWKELIDHCDAIITTDLPDTRFLIYAHEKNKLIISENQVPIEHLEYYKVRMAMDPNLCYNDIVSRYKLQILVTDHFITRSSVERATIIASLVLLGRIDYDEYNNSKNLSTILSHIPIGFNSFSDEIKNNTIGIDKTIDFIWNGGIWDFYEPCIVPEAIRKLKDRNIDVNMKFMYFPSNEQLFKEAMNLHNKTKELQVEDQIKFVQEYIPHLQRDKLLNASRAIIVYAKDSIENYTCHRLRLRDAFLYNLPVITDKYGATGDLVEQLNIGITVRNEIELARAMERIKYDEDFYQQLVLNLQKVREQFKVENHVHSLVNFLNNHKKLSSVRFNSRDKRISDLLSANSDLLVKPNSII